MIEVHDICFRWHPRAPLILNVPDFQIKAGERVFLEGPSGSGKTTLLNLLAGMVVPEQGSVLVNGTDLKKLGNAARDSFRADHIGVIFQMFNLIPYLSPIENVILPCRFSQRRLTMAIKNTRNPSDEGLRLLMQMQLTDAAIIASPTFQLSIGQQQRVAAARSLIGSPELIIADEPTSALDEENRHIFINLLFKEVTEAGATLLFISHDKSLAKHFDRRIRLTDINQAL